MGNEQKQHVEFFRKVGLRKSLLVKAGDGAVYAPFCGDGDLADACYRKKRIWAADIDMERVSTFAKRFPDARVVAGDCDIWPFPKCTNTFSVADFDAYSYPYHSFRAFWENAKIQYPLVMFFTDGMLQAIKRKKPFIDLLGNKHRPLPTKARHKLMYMYWQQTVLPWIREITASNKIVASRHYIRALNMCYWGVVIDE